MRALFDVNVLIALFDPDHLHHPRANEWWRSDQRLGWASCPLTQNGFTRVVSGTTYKNPVPLSQALLRLQLQTARREHAFWPDDIEITDADVFDHSRILGPRQITDVYLLGLAVKNGGRLITFDKGVPLAAVRGATPGHLVSI